MKENFEIIIPEHEKDIDMLAHIIEGNLEKIYNIELLVGLGFMVYALLIII